MKILVTGAGRGGTNLVTELMKKTELVTFTSEVEDRKLFNHGVLRTDYGTKLATENKGFNVSAIDRLLKNNSDMIVVFSLRHPIDNCLSKIVRGQPQSKGGDSKTEALAPDATVEGSVKALKHMFAIYVFLVENYPDRLITVKMEDLINNPDDVIKFISDRFDVKNPEKMKNFYVANRNVYQKNRYGNQLHDQTSLYENLSDNFNGFFKNKGSDVEKLGAELEEIIKYLKYSK